eukprot:366235-Chlamydomonas_euryale.AAC.9
MDWGLGNKQAWWAEVRRNGLRFGAQASARLCARRVTPHPPAARAHSSRCTRVTRRVPASRSARHQSAGAKSARAARAGAPTPHGSSRRAASPGRT